MGMWPLQKDAEQIQKNIADQNFANTSIDAINYIHLRGTFQRDLFANGGEAGFDVSVQPSVVETQPEEAEEEEVLAADDVDHDIDELVIEENEPEIVEPEVVEKESTTKLQPDEDVEEDIF